MKKNSKTRGSESVLGQHKKVCMQKKGVTYLFLLGMGREK